MVIHVYYFLLIIPSLFAQCLKELLFNCICCISDNRHFMSVFEDIFLTDKIFITVLIIFATVSDVWHFVVQPTLGHLFLHWQLVMKDFCIWHYISPVLQISVMHKVCAHLKWLYIPGLHMFWMQFCICFVLFFLTLENCDFLPWFFCRFSWIFLVDASLVEMNFVCGIQ